MKNAKISRRSFLLGLAACSAAGILTACKGDDTPASSASTSPSKPGDSAASPVRPRPARIWLSRQAVTGASSPSTAHSRGLANDVGFVLCL